MIYVIDYSSMVMGFLYGYMKKNSHRTTNTISNVVYQMISSKLSKFGCVENDVVIFAIDSPNSWRETVYPAYKRNRKDRTGDVHKAIKEIKVTVQKKVTERFRRRKDLNSIYIEARRTEADDIVAVLCTESLSDFDKVIISADKDFRQLINDNTTLVDPTDMSVVPIGNYQLNNHIIDGDTTDNIPGIVFYARIYENDKKIFNTNDTNRHLIMKDGFIDFEQYPRMVPAYNRNKELIDMSMIPEKIKRNILNIYMYELKSLNAIKNYQTVE